MARKAKKSSGRRKAAPQKALMRRLLRFGLLLALWGSIVVGTIVGWYALELPQITEAPKLIEQNAGTVKGKDGTVLARYGNLQGVATPVSELPAHLVYAVLAIEDRRFYKHPGVDPIGIIRHGPQPDRGLSRAGRIDDHAAIGQKPVPVPRPHVQAQGAGSVAGPVD